MIRIAPILDTLQQAQSTDWQALLDQTLTAFDCTTGTLHFLDPTDGLLHLAAKAGIPDFLLPKMTVIPIGKGMAGIAAERREPVQVCNLQTDESGVARPSAKDTQMEGSLASPLLLNGQLYGTIGIAKPVPYEFSDEEIAALTQISEAICRKRVEDLVKK
jgi:putative methionine-R-sulfoxide reductase with GAF domain